MQNYEGPVGTVFANLTVPALANRVLAALVSQSRTADD